MTREEAARIIKKCKEKGFKYTFCTLEEYYTALDMAIEALEQEPIEELDFVQPHKKMSINLEVCKMREATKEEREGIEQYIDSIAEPCEDVVSRHEVKEQMIKYGFHAPDMTVTEFVEDLPPVNPQPKTGHWTILEEWKNDFKGFINKLSMPKDDYKGIMEYIDEVPNEARWIPVNESLPRKSGNYWCTFGGTNLTGSDYYTTETAAVLFFDDPEEHAGWRSQNVVAWMPLPKSFKPQGSEEREEERKMVNDKF